MNIKARLREIFRFFCRIIFTKFSLKSDSEFTFPFFFNEGNTHILIQRRYWQLMRMGTKSKEVTGKFFGKLKLFVNELHDFFTQPKSSVHALFKLRSITFL